MAPTYGEALSLSGVADAWEGNKTIRDRFRSHHRLFQARGDPDNYEPKAHVKEASFSHKILEPIAKCLGTYLDEDGGFQLFTINQAEEQMPSCMHMTTHNRNTLHSSSEHVLFHPPSWIQGWFLGLLRVSI